MDLGHDFKRSSMRILPFFLFSFMLISTLALGQQKVLFLGNSYTYFNDLPQQVELLAKSLGDTLECDSYTPGGYRFQDHANDESTYAHIRSQAWDFVFLQGQSQEVSMPPAQLQQEVYPYAEQLIDSIKANHGCSEPVFYMTWGRKYGDSENCSQWPPVCTFLGMQQRITAGYMTMAETNGTAVAPIGLAWKHSMDYDPDSLINLYSQDNSHPSLRGSYLTACVMVATILQKSPEGSDYYGMITAPEAQYLQQIARQVVLGADYSFEFYDEYTNINYDLDSSSWIRHGNIASADIFHTHAGLDYQFNGYAINGDELLWDFGDGESSTLPSPLHQYQTDGDYVVKLTATNACFEAVAIDSIHVTTTNTTHPDKESIFIRPTGISNQYELSAIVGGGHVSVMNIHGKLLLEKDMNQNSIVVNLSDYRSGIYFIRVESGNERLVKKVVVR